MVGAQLLRSINNTNRSVTAPRSDPSELGTGGRGDGLARIDAFDFLHFSSKIHPSRDDAAGAQRWWGRALGAGDDLAQWLLTPAGLMDPQDQIPKGGRRPPLRHSSDSKNSPQRLHTSITSATSLRSINVMHCHLNEASVSSWCFHQERKAVVVCTINDGYTNSMAMYLR